MKKPEILAPAGSMQALRAVVAAGCDAVYMGGSRFGARAYAENPDTEEMIEAIRFCHLHDVKLYMTVNTLLKEKELAGLREFMVSYYEAGVDAVLVQDMGVLSVLREWFPDLNLHASTQMTITQGKTAEYLKEYGVTRIVPARELSLPELRRMREETDVEIEVFVHGALCYCFSGQCLFSSMQGGRSGNRGRCAQPCRQLYQMEKTGKKGYFLSPKELCNLEHIDKLITAGVDSFKIEGRMKRAEYAAFVTEIYRKYVDLYFLLGKKGYAAYLEEHRKEWEEDNRDLADFYNREGFTSGYLTGKMGNVEERHPGKRGEMLSMHRPRHGGVLVGRVVSSGKQTVVYEASEEIYAQDVVEFRDKKMNALYEYTLGENVNRGARVEARFTPGTKISAGDFLYRTRNAMLLTRTKEHYIDVKNQIPVRGEFFAESGKPLRITVWRGEYKAEIYGEICQEAKNQPATEESVRKTLTKTGESRFFFESLEIILEEGVFFRVGVLKELRREAFFQLERTLLQVSERKCRDLDASKAPESQEEEQDFFFSASVMNMEQLEAVLSGKEILRIYVQMEEMNSFEVKKAFFRIQECQRIPWLVLPAVLRSGVEKILWKEWERKDGLFSVPWAGILVKNQESFLFAKELQKKRMESGKDFFAIGFDASCYVMNRSAYAFYKREGSFVTIPFELTGEEIKATSYGSSCELIGYGRIPLMVSAQCMQANLMQCAFKEKRAWNRKIVFCDEKRRKFVSVNYCRYCYSIIYQETPIYLKEILEEKEKDAIRSFRYAFTTENGQEVRDVLSGEPPFPTWKGHFYRGIE